MCGNGFCPEAADQEVESIRGGIEVRVIDLVRVAGKDDLSAAANTGDDGLSFERSQVLRLVDDHELVGNAAATNVAQRLNDDAAGAHEVSTAAMFVAHVKIA